jgi:hypothetical protein
VLPDPGFLIRNPGLCCAKTFFRSAKTLFRSAKTFLRRKKPVLHAANPGLHAAGPAAARNRAGHHDEVWRGVVAGGTIGGKGTCGGCSLRMFNALALMLS